MKMITGLTKANIKNTGIKLAPEHDFTDDGNRFRGFIYKGMPMTQCRANGECYLSIRTDYLEGKQFTWKEWSKTEEYHLEDEFNGVSEFDLDKLIENLEKIIAKVNEMNAKASAEEIDMTEIARKAKDETIALEKFIGRVQTSLKWWKLREYDLKSAGRYMEALIKKLDQFKTIDFNSLSRVDKMKYVETLKDLGYVYIDPNDFYIRQLKEYIAKTK